MTVGLRAHHQGCACTSINNGVWFWGWGRKRVGEGDWNRRCGGAQDEAPPAPSVACWGLAESVLEEMGGLGRAWWGLRGLDLITGRWTQSQAEQIRSRQEVLFGERTVASTKRWRKWRGMENKTASVPRDWPPAGTEGERGLVSPLHQYPKCQSRSGSQVWVGVHCH